MYMHHIEEPGSIEPSNGAIKLVVQQYLKSNEAFEVLRNYEGGEHAVWQIGTRYIVRALPSSRDWIAWLTKDVAIRKLVRQHQLWQHIVSDCIAAISVDRWVGNLDVWIQGTSLEDRKPTQKTETDLAYFVAALWSTPVGEVSETLLEKSKQAVQINDLVECAHQSWTTLLRSGYVTNQAADLGDVLRIDESTRVVNFDETNVLLHNDLKGGHILLGTSDDDEDDALAGVIDWSDTTIGDVAVDIGGLAISVGQSMTRRVALAACVSHGAVQRGIQKAMCDNIIRLSRCVNGDDDGSLEWLLRRSFQRAFEGTPLVNGLVKSD